ncbi:hypothetical protein WR25_05403 [Diploscapter pachys]|uniref:C2 domain-containing protein n=1 Tax=Diploscapter pachys TaxID=2018661 RepID=A0A2A2KA06_9BILA|nr:hypothetical protein WR25_05403 [Diploscapter pachys]
MHRMSNGGISNGDSRRNSMVDASGRFCSQPNTGSSELSLGLCYDTSSECLTISVEKGASIGEMAKPPDTFVKILVKNGSGKEIHRDKTETVKCTAEPIYNRQTAVQIHKSDIETTTVIVEVWRVAGFVRAKQVVGSVALGYESSTSDAQEHWEQMIRSNGIPLSKWHPIQSTE